MNPGPASAWCVPSIERCSLVRGGTSFEGLHPPKAGLQRDWGEGKGAARSPRGGRAADPDPHRSGQPPPSPVFAQDRNPLTRIPIARTPLRTLFRMMARREADDGRREARTQGAPIFLNIGATEDAASRRPAPHRDMAAHFEGSSKGVRYRGRCACVGTRCTLRNPPPSFAPLGLPGFAARVPANEDMG